MPDFDIITYRRPDGETVNLSVLPYTTLSHDGFGIGEFQSTEVAPPGGHGSYWVDTRMDAKVVTIEFSYTGAGVPEQQGSRRNVIRLFNPLLGPGVLRIDQVNGVSLEMRAILAESLPLPVEEGAPPGYYRTLVRFKSDGIPALYDPIVQSLVLNFDVSVGNFSFPWSFPRMFAQSGLAASPVIDYIGDIETPVRIEIHGPAINPLFRNETTDRTIALTGLTLTAGQVLIIDTDPSAYVVQVDGVDVWNYLSDIDMWGLVPGENTITLDIGGTVAGVTTGSIQWYNRYLGQ